MKAAKELLLRRFGRNEATRTPDPYVPNVVRYQLRYIPISYRCLSITGAKVVLFSICAKYFRVFFMNIANEHRDTKTQSFF